MKSLGGLTQDQRTELNQNGWICTSFDSVEPEALAENLLSIANDLGTPVPSRKKGSLVEILKPVSGDAAHQQSLSRIFEEGEFPLHTDTAHWTTPCRYVLISCANNGGSTRATTLLDIQKLELEEDERDLLRTTVFSIKNGRSSFFSSILSSKRSFVRYDPGCMRAVTPNADATLEILKKSRWKELIVRIEWEPGLTLIIDNWRLLHGRESCSQNDETRTLFRTLVQ